MPTELLILTNSLDGTSDILVELCRQKSIDVFRWNVDLFFKYEISLNSSNFVISDPVGRTIDVRNGRHAILWRKPYLSDLKWEGDEEVAPILISQAATIVRTILNTRSSFNQKMLVEPYAEDRLTKLQQLWIARDYFDVPDYELTISASSSLSAPAVTKPLRENSTSNNQIFYTSLVEPSDLARPFPWFVQRAILGGSDLTAVYINGKTWFYRCDYRRDNSSIDWRTAINTESEPRWAPWTPPFESELQVRIYKMMRSMDLNYGRIDFILDKRDTLWFLECNPNGQFGWLDNEELELHKAFLNSALGMSLY